MISAAPVATRQADSKSSKRANGGTGRRTAIVRDVAEIYVGTARLEESEDVGGLLLRLRLPMAS